MGQKKAPASAKAAGSGSQTSSADAAGFADAIRGQIANKQRLVRAFDVGGGGVKTALFAAPALLDLLVHECAEDSAEARVHDFDDLPQLQWIEVPHQLGAAPGEDGFATWLLEAVPRLRREISDSNVCFGVSVGGDVNHKTGLIEDWWPGGGYPRSWDDGRKPPRVSDLMGLPSGRTFVLHDGEAHLLGCSRRLLPPPASACLTIGTGIGHGISAGDCGVVDPCSKTGMLSHDLNGVPLSGATYKGTWQHWLNNPGSDSERAEAVMSKDFADMSRPWNTPWTSLVLGRRGIELAEAVHGCDPPPDVDVADGSSEDAVDEQRAAAVQAYGEQWLHFLNTQFVPQFCAGTRRHPIERLCFAGGVVDRNWRLLREVLVDAETSLLKPLGASTSYASQAERPGSKRGRSSKTSGSSTARLQMLPPAPSGSGLIGAGMYALAGMGGAAMAIWAS